MAGVGLFTDDFLGEEGPGVSSGAGGEPAERGSGQEGPMGSRPEGVPGRAGGSTGRGVSGTALHGTS